MPHTLLNHYRAVELTSAQMLACATAADWHRVLDCEQRCGELIQQLGAASRRSGLTPEQRLEKGEIMKRILQMDAQIRNLAEPSVARFAYPYHHSVTPAATP